MPDDSWWILTLFVHEIAGIAAISCKSLQRHGALLCNQHHTLQRLVLEINKVGIVGILTEAQRGAIDEATHQLSDSGYYAVAFTNVSGCMEDLGMFVKDRLSAMDSGHRETLLRLSASAILESVDGNTPLFRREPKTTKPISTRLRMFYPISLSAFCPATSAFICSATGSSLIIPSATRSRLLGACTRLGTTRTTANPM
jgi:hypothetical protein